MVALSLESLIVLKSLSLGRLKGHLLDGLAVPLEIIKLSDDLSTASLSDLLLAAGATKEGKADLERVPAVLQELQHTACMKNVSATKLNTCLVLELTGEADIAKFIIAGQVGSFRDASRIKTGQAVDLTLAAIALMATR